MSCARTVLLHTGDAESIEVSSAWMNDSTPPPELPDQ